MGKDNSCSIGLYKDGVNEHIVLHTVWVIISAQKMSAVIHSSDGVGIKSSWCIH